MRKGGLEREDEERRIRKGGRDSEDRKGGLEREEEKERIR